MNVWAIQSKEVLPQKILIKKTYDCLKQRCLTGKSTVFSWKKNKRLLDENWEQKKQKKSISTGITVLGEKVKFSSTKTILIEEQQTDNSNFLSKTRFTNGSINGQNWHERISIMIIKSLVKLDSTIQHLVLLLNRKMSPEVQENCLLEGYRTEPQRTSFWVNMWMSQLF